MTKLDEPEQEVFDEDHESSANVSGQIDDLKAKFSTLRVAPLGPEAVLERCHVLLGELQKFADCCERKKFQVEYRQKVDYTHFRNDIQQEVRQMEKIKESDLPPERVQQLVNASNLSYWEALWSAAKQTSQITVLRRHGSSVDIISEGGLKWTKVSTISEKRLLMEMAKQGWDWGGMSDESSDDEGIEMHRKEDALLDISLVKMAANLAKIAKETRVKYTRPKVHFVLTRISRGNADIDLVLDAIKATGAMVQTAEQISDAPAIDDALENMVADEFKLFTETINVDCTLLLAMVSDISHGQVQEEPWFNKNVRQQIKIEEKEQLMANALWPATIGHNLVCTKLAAQRMREIVDFIGTKTEKARTGLIMGDGEGKSTAKILEELQQLSEHTIPSSWKLPITVVDDEAAMSKAASPLIAAVGNQLTDINRSVFCFGWVSGFTTITSNRVAAKTVEKGVEDNRQSDDDAGPDVWICPTARSLVAKEKDRRDGGGSDD